MRPLVLIAIATLALAACRDNERADTNRNAGAGLSADRIVANDVTAIDAVTADAANMAADVNYSEALAELTDNSAGNAASASTNASARPRARRPAAATAPTPAGNSTEAATNAQ